MDPRFRARPAFLGEIHSSEPVAYGGSSTLPCTRNWSDDRPLFSNRSDRSARAPGGPPLAPRSIQLEWRTVGGDLRHRQLDVIPALPPTQKIGPAKSLFREILRVSHSLPIFCGGDWDNSKAKRHPFIICQSTSQKILKGKWSSGVVSCRNLAQTKTNDV
jgi:hypothetical protein